MQHKSLIADFILGGSAPVVAEVPPPVSQAEPNALVVNEGAAAAFATAFEAGDELTEAVFTVHDSAGARVQAGQIFSHMPRAHLTGDGEWADHLLLREGGPQAQSCLTCHAASTAMAPAVLR